MNSFSIFIKDEIIPNIPAIIPIPPIIQFNNIFPLEILFFSELYIITGNKYYKATAAILPEKFKKTEILFNKIEQITIIVIIEILIELLIKLNVSYLLVFNWYS